MFYQKPLVTGPPGLVITDMAVSQNKGTPKVVPLILGNPHMARVAMQNRELVRAVDIFNSNVGFRV